MKRFRTSIAAWTCAAALGSFALLYNLLPYSVMTDLAMALAFGVTLAVTFRYALDGLKALRGGRLGAEFLLVAVFSTYAILSIQRGWIWFVQANTAADGSRPFWLINTSMSVFLPWMIAWAGSMALIAPEIGESRMVTRPSLWRSVILFVSGAAAGFVLATSLRAPPAPALILSDGRVICSPSTPVIGSSSRVYHTTDSPYRGMVRSGWCFDTVGKAEAAGFRAPK